MNEKYSCIVDTNGIFVDFVLLLLTKQEDSTEEWVVQYYTLKEGERLVDTMPPNRKTHAGAAGLVCPQWDEGAAVWVEGATTEEIAAWEAEHPNPVTLEEERAATLKALSTASYAAIVGGCDVALSDGTTEHFSLQETDQINLTAAVAAVEQGAAGYPYHADGRLCRLFPAADILGIATAATVHKLHHTTYCNHLNVWARRAEMREELTGIVYGAELPADLAANMEEVLTSAASM